MRSLIKTIQNFKRITSGRHPESPGQNATSQMPHPNPPKDIPHIREDTQTTVNLKKSTYWTLKIRGRQGSFRANSTKSHGPGKLFYALENGEEIPSDLVDGVIMYSGSDIVGPNSNTSDTSFHLAKSYNNWRMPSDEELSNEYDWEYRHIKRHLGDIFPSKEHFLAAAKSGKIQDMPANVDRATSIPSVSGVKNLVSEYQHPRDVDRIVQGLSTNAQMPTPVVIRHANGHFMMGGNTRQNLARIHGAIPKVLVIDADNLQKGALKRLAPHHPKPGETEQTKHLRHWVVGQRPKVREELPRHEDSIRTRGIAKLFGATSHRRNPKTGELEFLLHRGASNEELENHLNNTAGEQRTSWTPDVRVAKNFATHYKGKVLSAWIPEKHIHNLPYMEGHDRNPNFICMREELEVVVNPHDIRENIEDYNLGSAVVDKYGPIKHEFTLREIKDPDSPSLPLKNRRESIKHIIKRNLQGYNTLIERAKIKKSLAAVLQKFKDEIPGGLADNKQLKDFDARQIGMGKKVEAEHTDDPSKQVEIAMDHLTENPEYYDKLKEIEPEHFKKGLQGDWQKEGYKIYHEYDATNNRHLVSTYSKDGDKVGSLQFREKEDGSLKTAPGSMVWVDQAHRRKGIASAMYSLGEEKTGKKFVSGMLTPHGAKLWDNPNRKFGKSLMAVLEKDFKINEFARLQNKSHPDGPKIVDHTDHQNEFPAPKDYQNYANYPKQFKGKNIRAFGGISAKMVHDVPKSDNLEETNTYMAKPYHKKIESATKAWCKYPILGWATMATKSLFNAAGIGDLCEDVSVHTHNNTPMTVHKFAKEYKPFNDLSWGEKLSGQTDNASKIAVLDFLANNVDRHYGNLMFHPITNKILAIDHERSFQYQKPQADIRYGKMPENVFGYLMSGALRNAFTPNNYDPDYLSNWWEKHGQAIHDTFHKEVSKIKDKHIRDHLTKNFMERWNHVHDYMRHDPWSLIRSETQSTDIIKTKANPITVKAVLGKLPEDPILALKSIDQLLGKKRSHKQVAALMQVWHSQVDKLSPSQLVEYHDSEPYHHINNNSGGAPNTLREKILESGDIQKIRAILEHSKKMHYPFWRDKFEGALK